MARDRGGRGTVLVTGANGYIGNALAKAFSRAGWRTFGLTRRREHAGDLARQEVHPLIGSPEDLAFLDQTGGALFDVIVSNTEDARDPRGHFAKVQTMLEQVAGRSRASGDRPLVMFTSGCKDYGSMSTKHGDAVLVPHTEEDPLNPPAQLAPRKDFGLALLHRSGTEFDATVLRPTIVYGYSSSYYGALFELAASSDTALRLQADPDAIMHSLHVDDCADAYVALAEHPVRDKVAGQAFNLSNARYETARDVGGALAASYGLGLEFVPRENVPMQSVHGLANFSQWVGSDKVRALTGWGERRATFIDGLAEYRLAFEASKQKPQP